MAVRIYFVNEGKQSIFENFYIKFFACNSRKYHYVCRSSFGNAGQTWTLLGCFGVGFNLGSHPFFRKHVFPCSSSMIVDSSFKNGLASNGVLAILKRYPDNSSIFLPTPKIVSHHNLSNPFSFLTSR